MAQKRNKQRGRADNKNASKTEAHPGPEVIEKRTPMGPTDPQSGHDVAQPPKTGNGGEMDRIAQLECENSDLRNQVVTLEAQLREADQKMAAHSCTAGMEPFRPADNTESADLAGWNDRIDKLQQNSREADVKRAAALATLKSVLDDLHALALKSRERDTVDLVEDA